MIQNISHNRTHCTKESMNAHILFKRELAKANFLTVFDWYMEHNYKDIIKNLQKITRFKR